MAHPYPPHDDALPYTGKHRYFLTFCTDDGRCVFNDAAAVELVCAQFLRAASQHHYELTAYCFMPDHVHLIVSGLTPDAELKAFIARAKQYSGFHFKRGWGERLWQRYGFERVIRDDSELAHTIGYVLANPVRGRLAGHPSEYPHLGSARYSVGELLEMCEYERAVE